MIFIYILLLIRNAVLTSDNNCGWRLDDYWTLLGNVGTCRLNAFIITASTEKQDFIATYEEFEFRIAKATVIGNNHAKQMLAGKLSEMSQSSEEHALSLTVAFSHRQPLHIYLLTPQIYKTISDVYGSYDAGTHSMHLPYYEKTNNFFKIDTVAHEFRHRAMHVLNSQLSGRPTFLSLPYFPFIAKVVNDFSGLLKLGDDRIAITTKKLVEDELVPEKKSKKNVKRLGLLRNKIKDQYGKPLSLTVKKTLDNTIYNVIASGIVDFPNMLFNNKHVLLKLNEHYVINDAKENNKGETSFNMTITDPVRALIIDHDAILQTLKKNYPAGHFLFEQEAWLWGEFNIETLREFYPEVLTTINKLLHFAIKHPRHVNYDEKIMSLKQSYTYLNLTKPDLALAARTPIHNKLDAQTVFFSTLPNTGKQATDEIKVYQHLIASNFLVAESYAEMAFIQYHKNELLLACRNYQRSDELFPIDSVNSKLTEYDLLLYGHACLTSFNLPLANRAFAAVIELGGLHDGIYVDVAKQTISKMSSL